MENASVRRCVLGACALLAVSPGARALPPGFTLSTVASGINFPTCMDIAPDGAVYVFTFFGQLLRVDPGAEGLILLGQVPVNVVGCEQGGLGIALAPDFPTTRAVYLSFTAPDRRGTVSRFTLDGESLDLTSEKVVWKNPSVTENCHNAGGIAFMPDGSLLIATGDREQGALARDLTSQDGKILRLLADGGVPSDNPYVGEPGVDPAIWASGLRNPYRLSVDAPSGRVWIGDVGGNRWEEVNIGVPRADYGWDLMEGPECDVPDCSAFTPPFIAYSRTDPAYFGGRTVTMGPTYRGSLFPSEYGGNVFFADYVAGWVRRIVVDASGDPVQDVPFLEALQGRAITDLKVGPDGALYLVRAGSGSLGRILRIGYQSQACVGDLDGDGAILYPDLTELVAGWGQPGPADFDEDGAVGPPDLAQLLASWGLCPQPGR